MLNGFAEFMFKHKIPATAAAFSIGGASAEMAKTMSTDLVLPVFYRLVYIFYPRIKVPKFQALPFFNAMISWACVLFTSYVLMEIVFARGVIGASTVVLDKKEEAELSRARNMVIEPLQQAKRAVQEMVGLVGAPDSVEYQSVPQAVSMNSGIASTDRSKSSSGVPRAEAARLDEFGSLTA